MTTNAPRSITEPTITAAQSVAPDQGRKEDTMSELAEQTATYAIAVMDRDKQIKSLQDAVLALTAEGEALRKQNDDLRESIHSCGPTCMKAGCLNRRLMDEVETLRRKLFVASGKTAPCAACGYNGPGFYQAETHPCAGAARPGEKG